ncbi:MAG: M15 family metallopeptidase [Lachnospiraceae bacterium]|nr:M15 family metallopeptidase [Lachnospiraceae bacterium]
MVNKNNPLPEDYQVDLKTLPDGVNRAAKEAYQPLCDMLNAGKKEGLSFEICSSYRDVERQGELFGEDLLFLMNQGYSYIDAYREVAKETMPPGYSEHATGLAFDIVALDYQMLEEGQARTAENKWLREHCAEYGFILRYPAGKEDITFINYESWHFRYVGREEAKYIMENGITLEEYLDLFE